MDKSEEMENSNCYSSNKDEHGSVLCKKFEETQESIKEVAHSFQEKREQKVNSEGMNMKLKLAQISSQCGGLLSPEFFSRSSDVSTLDSSSDCVSSANTSRYPPEGDNITSETNNQGAVTPFSFPKIVIGSEEIKNTEMSTYELIHSLERVDILDDDPDGNDEAKWVECHPKYIQQQNYRLGIQPGGFYKNKTHPLVCVKLPHRANYEVLVTNNNRSLCHLDLYVNGKPTNALVLRPGETKAIDGPQYSKYAFKIFRSNDAPACKEVNEGDSENGIVKAVFTPKMQERLRCVSEPRHPEQTLNDLFDILDDLQAEKKPRSYSATNDGDRLERSLDMSKVAEGLTLLQGEKKKKRYIRAPELEVDPSKQVVLQLKLIASLVEEVAATEEDVHVIEPPTPPPP